MSISAELFMAILAMDSSNRGYGADIEDDSLDSEGNLDGLGESGLIGNAIISTSSAILLDADGNRLDQQSGFYAISYVIADDSISGLSAGETVISYRGTNADTAADFMTDALNGYGLAAGIPAGNQPWLAAQFYQEITGTTGDDPRTGSAILTGHSLGGGLAGFVAALYGQEAYIYDNMTFEQGAQNVYNWATSSDPVDMALQQALLEGWGDYYNGLPAWEPTISDNINAYATNGEFLSALREVFDQQSPVTYYDSFDDTLSPFDLHSSALLIDLMFAEEEGHTAWSSIATPLFAALFSDDIGAAAGFDVIDGAAGDSAQMMSAIAYSALDSGSAELDASYGYVFGNTAIRAMLDDADELGALVSADALPDALAGSVSDLAEAIVEFAGLMASAEINYHDYLGSENLFHPEEGILALSTALGEYTSDGSAAALLEVNVNKDLWSLNSSAEVDILHLPALAQEMYDEATIGIDGSLIETALLNLYGGGASAGAFDIMDILASVQFGLLDASTLTDGLHFAEPDTAFDADHASLFLGTDGDESIFGNSQNNIIAGGVGDDVLEGGAGNDVLIGGGGEAQNLISNGGFDDVSYIFGQPSGEDAWTYTAASALNIGATGLGQLGDGYALLLGATANLTASQLLEDLPDGVEVSLEFDIASSLGALWSTTGYLAIFWNGDEIDRLTNVGDWEHLAYTLSSSDGDGSQTLSFAYSGADAFDQSAFLIDNVSLTPAAADLTGADTLTGGSGNDWLFGGLGDDTFVFHAGFGLDVIEDFMAGAGSQDVILFDMDLFADFTAVMDAACQIGTDTVITFDAGNAITLDNVLMSDLYQDDFRFC